MTTVPSSPEPPLRVLFVTPNFENNSLGRTYCLWLLARRLGWTTRVVGVKGGSVWAPLADSEFAASCAPAAFPFGDQRNENAVFAAAADVDLIVAVKPLPTSFGVALRVVEHTGTPLLLDIDDPDIEVRTVWRSLADRVKNPAFSARQRDLVRLGRRARSVPRIVSNPELQHMYGGAIVPHVREIAAGPVYSASTEPVVRFVGSPRAHKGVAALRRSVAEVASDGVTLEVTGDAPADARSWERWLGTTTLAEGEQLVATADIVAVPSLATSWTPAQLPVKLIDAMMHGRAIVASASPPILWALGDAGLTTPPGDTAALAAAIGTLRDAGRRESLGRAARARALEHFSVDAVAPTFAAAARAAMAATKTGSGIGTSTSTDTTTGTTTDAGAEAS